MVNSILAILIFIPGLYLMHKYKIPSGYALWPILLPIILLLERLKLLRGNMIITKKEAVEIFMMLYTVLIFYIFFSNLDTYENYTFSATLKELLMLYFYPLIFILPFVIIIGVPIFGILYIKDKIFNTRPKVVYNFEQAALFIHQHLSDEIVKKVTEENVVGILILLCHQHFWTI